jgi:hypothetical protein
MRNKIYKFTNSVPVVFGLVLVMWGVLMADRGMIPVMPGISVYEPGQKAIIAWNGKKEILILSTDVYAEGETRVLEILPLPAEPKVEKGSFESFEVIERFIRAHAPIVHPGRPAGKLAADKGEAAVEVLFYEEIGAHSITCVRATDWDEFSNWVKDYIEKEGLSSIALPDTFVDIIEKYIRNQFQYFIFDITELGTESRSVEPLAYTFKTDYLFFPLEITSIVEGETDITLFLLTKESVNLWNTGTGLRPGTYYRRRYMHLPIDDMGVVEESGSERDSNIIAFSLSPREQKEIQREIDLLFWGNVRLGVLQYHGSTRGLRNDLLIR